MNSANYYDFLPKEEARAMMRRQATFNHWVGVVLLLMSGSVLAFLLWMIGCIVYALLNPGEPVRML